MGSDPAIRSSTAVLAVADVPAAAAYYRDVLGFEIAWTWGEPPTFGCVKSGEAEVFLNRQSDLAAKVEGHQHCFFVEAIDALHGQHQQCGAQIVSPIANKPWGIREYTVRDLNGYHLRFGGPAEYQRPITARDELPETIEIIGRMPTLDEYQSINDVVGYDRNRATMPGAIENSLCGAVALDRSAGGRIVGMVRVVGDGARFVYIQDVMVRPEYQGQKIGRALMETMMSHLRANYPKGASVALFTGKPAFYERFGFKRSPHAMTTAL